MMMERRGYKKIGAIVFCALVLLCMVQVREARADAATKIVIDPGLIDVKPGDNFTITINVTNVVSLTVWQLVLKYNLTVMNITSIWVPEHVNVFGDLSVITPDPVFGRDILDGMGFVYFGSSLFLDQVTSSNGILCKANCTVLGEGETTILVGTSRNRAHQSINEYDAFYSFLSDAYGNDIPYAETSATLISGGTPPRPIALFTVQPSLPDNTTRLVLQNKLPLGDTPFSQAYVGFPVTFNASASFGVYDLANGTKARGNEAISMYFWDFGDGNSTSTPNPIINYTYTLPGRWYANLTVEDKESPPAKSDQVGIPMYVGLVLDYFNWTPLVYSVLTLAGAGLTYYIFLETRKYVRSRRAMKAQELLMKKNQPL
jgi:hypothetical protein